VGERLGLGGGKFQEVEVVRRPKPAYRAGARKGRKGKVGKKGGLWGQQVTEFLGEGVDTAWG